MRIVFILLTLILVGCKPDPIDACVAAQKKAERQQFDEMCKKLKETGNDGCREKDWNELVITFEKHWWKDCMKAAAGKE